MRFLSAAGNNKGSGDSDTGRSRAEQQGIYPPPNKHGSPRGPPKEWPTKGPRFSGSMLAIV